MAFKDDVAFINKTTKRKILQFKIINIAIIIIFFIGASLWFYEYVASYFLMGTSALYYLGFIFAFLDNRKEFTKIEYEGIENLYLVTGDNRHKCSFKVGHIVYSDTIINSANKTRQQIINGEFDKPLLNNLITKYADELRLKSTDKIKIK